MLFWSSLNIVFYTIVSMTEAPIFAAFLPDPAKLGCYIAFLKGFSSPAVILVPLFTRRGVINGCRICLILGLVFTVFSIFAWQLTLPPNRFFKNGLAIGLLINVFILTGLDSIRYILFMVFARSFNDKAFITVTFLGSEFLGLMVSAVEFLQDVGHRHLDGKMSTNFNFGPTVALTICTIFYISSCTTFVLLTTVDSARKRSVLFHEPVQKQIFQQNGQNSASLSDGGETSYSESSFLLSASSIEVIEDWRYA